MIKSCRSKDAAALSDDMPVRRFEAIERPARRKLLYLHRARVLEDLKAPPGNQREAFKGDRRGHHSIGIDGQWRICFIWKKGDAHDVEIAHHH